LNKIITQPNSINAADIAAALGGRPNGSDSFTCCCPAHEDKSPSLSIKDTGDKILLHCFAGCSFEEIVSVLRSRGLWPEFIPKKYKGRRPVTERYSCREIKHAEIVLFIAGCDRRKGLILSEADLISVRAAMEILRHA
jgi:hypothetical protein